MLACAGMCWHVLACVSLAAEAHQDQQHAEPEGEARAPAMHQVGNQGGQGRAGTDAHQAPAQAEEDGPQDQRAVVPGLGGLFEGAVLSTEGLPALSLRNPQLNCE